jgi:DNA polymerase-3 subunit delta'
VRPRRAPATAHDAGPPHAAWRTVARAGAARPTRDMCAAHDRATCASVTAVVPALADIRGQDRAIEILRRAIAQDRVAHAYLFSGPDGAGKRTTALALACALNCEQHPGEGCPAAAGDAACVSCSKIAADLHPDVRPLERSGAAQIIAIETVRGRIAELGLPPHEGRARIILVEEAAALPEASANALLKTLEEPPRRTHFVLCTAAPHQILATIRSRCQRLRFSPLPAELRAALGADEASASAIGALADKLLAAVRARSSEALYKAAAESASDRAQLLQLLRLLTERLADTAREAARQSIRARASSLCQQTAAVIEAERAVALHNAHGQLAVEQLLHQLRALEAPADATPDATPGASPAP